MALIRRRSSNLAFSHLQFLYRHGLKLLDHLLTELLKPAECLILVVSWLPSGVSKVLKSILTSIAALHWLAVCTVASEHHICTGLAAVLPMGVTLQGV